MKNKWVQVLVSKLCRCEHLEKRLKCFCFMTFKRMFLVFLVAEEFCFSRFLKIVSEAAECADVGRLFHHY